VGSVVLAEFSWMSTGLALVMRRNAQTGLVLALYCMLVNWPMPWTTDVPLEVIAELYVFRRKFGLCRAMIVLWKAHWCVMTAFGLDLPRSRLVCILSSWTHNTTLKIQNLPWILQHISEEGGVNQTATLIGVCCCKLSECYSYSYITKQLVVWCILFLLLQSFWHTWKFYSERVRKTSSNMAHLESTQTGLSMMA